MDVGVEAELLVAGSDDGVVAVWSLAAQHLIHSLLGHTGRSERSSSRSWMTLAPTPCQVLTLKPSLFTASVSPL